MKKTPKLATSYLATITALTMLVCGYAIHMRFLLAELLVEFTDTDTPQVGTDSDNRSNYRCITNKILGGKTTCKIFMNPEYKGCLCDLQQLHTSIAFMRSSMSGNIRNYLYTYTQCTGVVTHTDDKF